MRTKEEIENYIDQLSFRLWDYSKNGDDETETIVFGKLTVVYWMLKETMPPVEVLYVRGEKCFQKGLQIDYRVGRV